MISKYSLLVLTLGISTFFSLGCGKETERDKIGDAQICLDKVTAADPDIADTCLAKVADVSSKAGDNIRCAGAFVKEGYTDVTTLINTFSAVGNDAGSASFLTAVVFDGRNSTNLNTAAGATTYYNQAKSASTYCASAGLKVGTLITTFAFLGNALINIGCQASAACGVTFFNFDPGTNLVPLASYFTNPSNTAGIEQLYSDLGTLVINSYLISCSGKAVSETLCTSISTAVTEGGGTSNPAGVGKKLITTTLDIPGLSIP